MQPHERRPLVTEVLQLDCKRLKAVLKGPVLGIGVMTWAHLGERLALLVLPKTMLPTTSAGSRTLLVVPIDPSAPLQDERALVAAIVARLAAGQIVPLRATKPYFGGERIWFVCARCDRRARLLYRPAGGSTWACRRCLGLTYECRRRHRDRWYDGIDRLWRTEERIRADLFSRSRRRQARAVLALMKLSPEQLIARTFPRLRGEG